MNIFKTPAAICSAIGFNKNYNVRRLWGYLNIVFNSMDQDRLKLLGPDRVCAEWLLRNGAAIKWAKATEFTNDYNKLPLEAAKKEMFIQEVDASNSSISHYGFDHFKGCKHIDTIILHKCTYIENKALIMLEPLRETLKYLRVSSCGNVTDDGIKSLCLLSNLEKLIIGDLPYLNSKDNVISKLNQHLPRCHITFIEPK